MDTPEAIQKIIDSVDREEMLNLAQEPYQNPPASRPRRATSPATLETTWENAATKYSFRR